MRDRGCQLLGHSWGLQSGSCSCLLIPMIGSQKKSEHRQKPAPSCPQSSPPLTFAVCDLHLAQCLQPAPHSQIYGPIKPPRILCMIQTGATVWSHSSSICNKMPHPSKDPAQLKKLSRLSITETQELNIFEVNANYSQWDYRKAVTTQLK
jgi:hypothetical protein